MTPPPDDPVSDPATLAALVSSRLCHDLIGPVGAIGNGIELLSAMLPASPELELIDESVATATAKLRYFRIAFGAPGQDLLEARALREALGGMYGAGRIHIDWTPEDLPRSSARLLLLLLLCTETALPLGGEIGLAVSADHIAIEARARRVQMEPAYWSHLGRGTALGNCPSARVTFPLARLQLVAEARPVEIGSGADWLTIGIGAAQSGTGQTGAGQTGGG